MEGVPAKILGRATLKTKKHLYPSSMACFSETSRDEVTFCSTDIFFQIEDVVR